MKNYTQNYRVKYFDVDARNEIKVSNLMDLLLDLSNRQMEESQLGTEELFKRNLGWVVTQYHFEVKRLPKANENVSLETTESGYNKYFCYRDFWVKDDAGEAMIYVHSLWIIMDLTSRKMVRLDEGLGEMMAVPLLSKVPRFPRVKAPKFDHEGVPYRIRFYDIDSNNHVNNSHYFEWMIDQLPLDVVQGQNIRQIDIKFENELVYGDSPESYMQLEELPEENLIKTYHLIANNNKKAAEAVFTWAK